MERDMDLRVGDDKVPWMSHTLHNQTCFCRAHVSPMRQPEQSSLDSSLLSNSLHEFKPTASLATIFLPFLSTKQVPLEKRYKDIEQETSVRPSGSNGFNLCMQHLLSMAWPFFATRGGYSRNREIPAQISQE